MTRTTPLRRTILHFSQRRLMEARTFIYRSVPVPIETIGYPTTGQVVWGELHQHPVAWEDADEVEPDLARGVSQHLVAVGQVHPKHSVGQCLFHYSLDLDRFFLSHAGPSGPDHLAYPFATLGQGQHLCLAVGYRTVCSK